MVKKILKAENLKGKLIIYSGNKGGVELRADTDKETIWATQAQIVDLFDVDQSVVSRHISNIRKDKEIDMKSNMQKMHIANSDKPTTLYSLDIILAVGYRTNSSKAIKFRQWATKTLREYLIKGFNIDKKKIESSATAFEDLRKVVDFIESKKEGRVKGTVVLKLKKELL
jgi:hypothetical protein